MPVLGLDIGTQTVGVAASDPLGYTAQPVETIRYDTPPEAYHRLYFLLREREIDHIVAGLPLNMNGSEGAQALKVREFLKNFKAYLTRKNFSVTIELRDERLSTRAAERTLLEADLSRAKRKKVIDKMAAVFILQGYLDSKI